MRILKRLVFGASMGFSLVAGSSVALTEPGFSQATKDAMLHVIAHEMGHAMLREFDLPILGPEEPIADDFATVYLYLMMPDRAEDIISARARQNLADGDGAGMFSEYQSDEQRAGRMVCILYAQDPERFVGMAQEFGLVGDDAADCRNFGTEVGRSWRRTIQPYLMPEGARHGSRSVC